MMKGTFGLIAALVAVVAVSASAAAQTALLDLRTESGQQRMVVDSAGGFVAYGFVRDVGNTTGCAAQIPATGAGTRFMWFPCRGAIRFGRAPIGPGATTWDDNNMDDFTFAGGNQVTASDYGAFAYGDQVTVSSTVGVGFGSGITVSGTAGFSAGASNVCSGFACTAIGYTVRAGGQGSVALGYRVTANNDYTVAMGYRASNNTHTGTFVWGDESTTDSVRNQADNEFRIRANGGVRLRVSTAANGNTPGAGGNVGCDLTVAVPSWTCASTRKIKAGFAPIDDDRLLSELRRLPITTWSFTEDPTYAAHVGPVAEDFYRAFGLGTDSTSLVIQDLAGVALASAQAVDRTTMRIEQSLELEALTREEELNALRAEVLELRARVEELTALAERLKRLEEAADP